MAVFDLEGTGRSTRFKNIFSQTVPYSSDLRERLLRIASGEELPMKFISLAHWDLGRFINKCASEFTQDYDVIAYSGHTVHHGPSTGNNEEGTFQLGELSILSASAGKTAVYDFRPSDMALGGLGAPLTAVSDFYLLRENGTLAVNIGGIGNITYVGEDRFVAFDTGPGNMLIDLAAMKLFGKEYDKNGVFASMGSVNGGMLDHMLDDGYLKLMPPKNSGREYYNNAYLDGLWLKFNGLGKYDFMRTVTRFTAASIHNQVEKFINGSVSRIVVGGGGTLNPVIVGDLKELFRKPVMRFSDMGIDDMYRECLGFAVLANQTLHLEPGRLPDNTMNNGEVIGKIIPGKNFREIVKRMVE